MNHKRAVADVFNVYIECDVKDGYKYYIDNPDDLEGDGLRSWLVDSYATLNQLQADRSLEHRIQFEDIPSGSRYLSRILEAMRMGRVLTVSYQGFGKDVASTFEVEPYGVKVYNRRWYLVGRSPYYDDVRIYGLDRMKEVEMSEKTFSLGADFDLKDFFKGCVGVIADRRLTIERVVVKVYGEARPYVASLPLHSSQTELEHDSQSTTYTYYVRPTYEFLQALLMQAGQVEVVSPQWVRDAMKRLAEDILARYQ